jgi:hypothetical protein
VRVLVPNTLTRLAPLLLALLLTSSAARAEDSVHDYVGVKKCQTCHKKELMGNQVGVWREHPHAAAVETLRSPQSLEVAQRLGIDGAPTEASECLRCHETAHGVAATWIAYDLVREDGVQCESCHGPGRDYRKKTIMSDRDEARAKGLWAPGEDSAICTGCHNRESPTFDLERYMLPDGSKAGFDFDQALVRIAHPIPAEVKGKYLELEEAQKKAKAGD